LPRLNITEYRGAERYRGIISELLPGCAVHIVIEPPFYCDYGYNIYAGENVYFNFNCVVLDVCRVNIGPNVIFGPGVQIYTATHPTRTAERREGWELGKPITIGADCWVGGGVIILPGVIIGERCVIGAGTLVSKDIPDDATLVGNPAR